MFSIFKSPPPQCETRRIGNSAHYRRRPVMRGLLLLLMLTFMNVTVAAESIRPFTMGSLAQVLEARAGKPFVLVFWSLDCQYCPTELKMLGELKRSHPKL